MPNAVHLDRRRYDGRGARGGTGHTAGATASRDRADASPDAGAARERVAYDLPLRLELEQQELEQRRQERKFDLDLTTPRARPFDVELPVPPTPAVAPLPPLPPVPAASSYVETNETRVPEALDGAFLNRRPPAAWAPHDPADSLYRLAREALNRGDYRRAAQLFNDLTQRFPNSAYAYVSTYYEAFSRYRIGTTEELRAADRALQALAGRYAAASNGSRDDTDVNGLLTRIRGALAMRGDSDAEITRLPRHPPRRRAPGRAAPRSCSRARSTRPPSGCFPA